MSLRDASVTATVSIHDADHFDADLVPLTTTEVLASTMAELDLERRWRVYVRPDRDGMSLKAFMMARQLYRRARLAPPWQGTDASARGAAMLRRLVNIELAHLHLMKQAIESESAWALIVEDDAHSTDPREFAQDLAGFVAAQGRAHQPRYVNLSRSFEPDPLGIDRHLSDIGAWGRGARLLSSDRPLTNTVCAILYRTDFLRELLPVLDAIPISPVLPIDWKLNMALLELHERDALGPGDCWFVEPGPLTQGSMHAAETA